MPANQLVTVTS